MELPGRRGAVEWLGALTLVLMSAVNFARRSDFRRLLVLPPLTSAVALAQYERRGRGPTQHKLSDCRFPLGSIS